MWEGKGRWVWCCALASLCTWNTTSAFVLPSSPVDRLRTTPLSVLKDVVHDLPTWELEVPVSELESASSATELDRAADKGVALQFGHKIPLAKYSFYEQASHVVVDEGDLYLVRVRSPGAHFLQLEFSRSHFPLGTHMCVFALTQEWPTSVNNAEDTLLRERNMYHRFAYFDKDLHYRAPPAGVSNTSLVVPPVHSDELVIELFVSKETKALPELSFEKAIHAYVDVFQKDSVAERGFYGDGPACLKPNNIKCFPEYTTESRGVLLFLNGGSLCSGSLVNNVYKGIAGQRVLTAAHCLPNGLETMTSFVFNYKTTDCNSNTGFTDDIVFVSILLGLEDGPDIALLQITQGIPSDYEVVYNGWETNVESNPSSMQKGVGIHHPGGDYMKLSESDGSPYIWSLSFPDGTNGKWTVNCGNGITAPGSSGSPLFNVNSGLIIGPLCCGGSFCDTPENPDWYGSLTSVFNSLVKPHLAGGEVLYSLGTAFPTTSSPGPGETIPTVNVTESTCTSVGGQIDSIGDGKCDNGDDAGAANNNQAECAYDGGDCCRATCIPSTYLCGSSGYDCQDPSVPSSASLHSFCWIFVVYISFRVICF